MPTTWSSASRSCPGCSEGSSSGSSCRRPVICSTHGSTRTRTGSTRWAPTFRPERITRKLVGDVARVAHAEGRRYAFTLHSGAALVAPNVRLPGHPLLLRGRSRAGGASARAPAGRRRGQRVPAVPVRPGRVLRARSSRAGSRSYRLPQLYADSTTTSAGAGSKRAICGARPWATERPGRRSGEGGERQWQRRRRRRRPPRRSKKAASEVGKLRAPGATRVTGTADERR